MGIKDFFFGRKYRKAMNEQLAKDLYTGMLIDHGYSPHTAKAEADRRIMHHKGAARIRKEKAKKERKDRKKKK